MTTRRGSRPRFAGPSGIEGDHPVAIPDGGGVRLPTGEVHPGEHYLLDSSLRIPLLTAGYRRQGVRPFAVETDELGGLHVYAWLVGSSGYRGERPHGDVEVVELGAEELAERLHSQSSEHLARVVIDGARSFRDEDDEGYYARNLRLLEPAYLRATTPQEGSGLGGSAETWRAHREPIVDGIDRDGTFLDIGCANGLLMESVRDWAAERGFVIEPYGVDLGPQLVELARQRYPHWASRIELGNAIDYVPSDGRRFTFVHTLLDCVPERRRGDLIRHVLDQLVEPGGRVLVSHYSPQSGIDPTAWEYLERFGLPVVGESGGTAWTEKP